MKCNNCGQTIKMIDDVTDVLWGDAIHDTLDNDTYACDLTDVESSLFAEFETADAIDVIYDMRMLASRATWRAESIFAKVDARSAVKS